MLWHRESRSNRKQGGFPPDEVEKLLDYYEVTEPHRAQLLSLAADANERGWWEEYTDAVTPDLLEFIGLEAEAESVAQWQVEVIPGLLPTREYGRHVVNAVQNFDPTAPGIVERRVQARIARQSVLTDRNPPLRLSLVIDESALLREIGGPEVMSAQWAHLAKMIELPNIELRVHPMRTSTSLMASSFVVFGFGSLSGTPPLGDVVSAESVASGELYVEGETDTYLYRLLLSSLLDASLSHQLNRSS